MLAIVAVGWSSASAVPAEAQDYKYAPGNFEFLERQYVFGSPNKVSVNGKRDWLGFEAQVGPHVTLLGHGNDVDPRRGVNREFRAIFTFQSYLRLTAADSAPVVTPSYMPELRLQWLRRSVTTSSNHPATDTRWGLTIDVWSHHSNGQSGCVFRGTATAPRTCPTKSEATGLNEDGGSFGTNHTGVTLHGRHSWGTAHTGSRWSLIGGAGLQFHHNVPGGGLDDDLRQLWGRWHGHGYGELRYRGNIATEPRARYAYVRVQGYLASGGEDDEMPNVRAPSTRASLELGCIWPRWHGIGVFVRGVTGRDYYNIQFTQDVSRLQLGIVLDTGGSAAALPIQKQPPPGGGGQAPAPPDTPPLDGGREKKRGAPGEKLSPIGRLGETELFGQPNNHVWRSLAAETPPPSRL